MLEHSQRIVIRNRSGAFMAIALFAFVWMLPGCMLKHADDSSTYGKSVTTAEGTCHFVNPGSKLHSVVFCERQTELKLHILERTYTYDKKTLERAVANQLRALIAATDIDQAWLVSATIDVWVAAPVLAPAKSHLVIAVQGAAVGFAVSLPLDPTFWDFKNAPMIQLGSSGYPVAHQRAWKSGQFVMIADRSIRSIDWQRFAGTTNGGGQTLFGTNPAGMPRVKSVSFAGEGIRLETAVFSEAMVARLLQESPLGRKYKLKPLWIPAFEVDSYRARGYSFTFRKGR